MMRKSRVVMLALGIALAILGLLEMDADVPIISSLKSWRDSPVQPEASGWTSSFQLGLGENVCTQRKRGIWQYLSGSTRPPDKGYFLSAVCSVYTYFGGSSSEVKGRLFDFEDIWTKCSAYVRVVGCTLSHIFSPMREVRNTWRDSAVTPVLTPYFTDVVRIIFFLCCSWIAATLTFRMMPATKKRPRIERQQDNPNSIFASMAAYFESFKMIAENACFHFFRAKSKETQRNVFVKCLRKGCSKTARKSLDREYGILKSINLPSVIKVEDWYQLGPTCGLGLEYAPFGNLKEAMYSEVAPIRDRFKFIMFRQICSAVRYLHGVGMVHLNIQPGNVLVFNRWFRVKLSGFDRIMEIQPGQLCRFFSLHALSISPEMAKRQPYDPYKADIWALGALFFNIITGDYLQKKTGLPLDRRVLPCLKSCDFEEKRGVMEILNCAFLPVPSRRPDATQLMRRFRFLGI